MTRKYWLIVLVTSSLLLFSGVLAALAQGADPAQPAQPAPLAPEYTYTTAITVTTTADEGGLSEKCSTPGKTCTLRRAINQARATSAISLPVRITFNIPTSDAGYDAAHQVWVIQLDSGQTGDAFIFRDLGGGKVIVDGATQPPGRPLSQGPRIILRGDNKEGAFSLAGGNNIIRGLAFQGLGDRMVSIPGTSNNLVEDNWFGLTVTGTEMYLRDPLDYEKGSGEIGVYVQSGGTNNTVQDNVFLGLDQGAIALDGDKSAALNNLVGTRADGTVPAVNWERKCRPNARYGNWFGGAGIQVYGHENRVEGNRIVGLLFQSADPASTPQDAISATGYTHTIRSNIIGVDAAGQHFGTCGEGIHIGGASGGHSIQVLTNTIAGSQGAAGILVTGGPYGYDLDGITVRGNVILGSKNKAFAFGDTLPAVLRNFNPAAVTSIAGTTVSGTSGADSPCANCKVELFLDRVDMVIETRQSLGIVTANAGGAWTAHLTRTLALTEGIRTASTTVADDQIYDSGSGIGYIAGTTTKLSDLYTQSGAPAPTPAPDPAPSTPPVIPTPVCASTPVAPSSYNKTLTVTSTADTNTAGTLRYAISQAKALTETQRPARIVFNIPNSEPGCTSDYCKITLGSDLPIVEGGRVTIDGSTQPTGRTTGPRIILYRSGGSASLRLGQYTQEGGYVVRGLALQSVRIYMSGDGNIVEDNWLGLNDAGSDIFFPAGSPGSDNKAIIEGGSGSDNHLVRNNRLAGSRTNAIKLLGHDNLVQANTIGLNASGTIPINPPDGTKCRPNVTTGNWFGGGGIYMFGLCNRIVGNTIAGLLIQGSATTTPPDAIYVPDIMDNLIQDNHIGQSTTNAALWTCGSGIDIGAGFTRILSNTIVNSFSSAIYLNGPYTSLNAEEMRGNVIVNSVSAIAFGPVVPAPLVSFRPGLVVNIDGVNVTGMADSYCPYCFVDVYLDDDDSLVEALDYLGAATADVDGDWSLTLPAALAAGQGLRTISTARDYGVVAGFEARTSSKLSALFKPQPPTALSSVEITGPAGNLLVDTSYTFTASVRPVTATLPITYVWEATGLANQTSTGGVENSVQFTWSSPGAKTVKVTASNRLGSKSDTYAVTIVEETRDFYIYLPLLLRQATH